MKMKEKDERNTKGKGTMEKENWRDRQKDREIVNEREG